MIVLLLGYAAIGFLLAVGFAFVSTSVESSNPPPKAKLFLGLHQSRRIVFRLSGLFTTGEILVQKLDWMVLAI